MCFNANNIFDVFSGQKYQKQLSCRPQDLKNPIEGQPIAFYAQFTPFFLISELCKDRVSRERKARGRGEQKKQGSLNAGRD